MSQIMQAARIHEAGGRFQIDQIDRPVARGRDVVVEVKAACVVPNLRNLMSSYGDRAYRSNDDGLVAQQEHRGRCPEWSLDEDVIARATPRESY